MTKKEYKAIAAELNAALKISKAEGLSAKNAALRIIDGLTATFYRMDKNFNPATFLSDCGTTE